MSKERPNLNQTAFIGDDEVTLITQPTPDISIYQGEHNNGHRRIYIVEPVAGTVICSLGISAVKVGTGAGDMAFIDTVSYEDYRDET